MLKAPAAEIRQNACGVVNERDRDRDRDRERQRDKCVYQSKQKQQN